MKDLHLGNA